MSDDKVKINAKKVTAYVWVSLDEDGTPLNLHGERMVETSPGVWEEPLIAYAYQQGWLDAGLTGDKLMTELTLPPECPPCDSSGYLVDWHDGLISCGYSIVRTAWFYSRRCPFCAALERHRLAWLLASMRMPGSARRI